MTMHVENPEISLVRIVEPFGQDPCSIRRKARKGEAARRRDCFKLVSGPIEPGEVAIRGGYLTVCAALAGSLTDECSHRGD